MRKLAAIGVLIVAALWFFWPSAAPVPPMLAGLSDDGLRGAPCPSRTLYEQDARRKHGAIPPSGLGERLRQKFPIGSNAKALLDELTRQGFTPFTPCANDEGVLGARWLAQKWGEPDAYIYWRTVDGEKVTFLDGHVSRRD